MEVIRIYRVYPGTVTTIRVPLNGEVVRYGRLNGLPYIWVKSDSAINKTEMRQFTTVRTGVPYDESTHTHRQTDPEIVDGDTTSLYELDAVPDPDNAGPPGEDGDPGKKGAPGLDGIDGTVWHSGLEAPDDFLGVIGDFYLQQEANQVLVWENIGAKWTVVVTISTGTVKVSADDTLAGFLKDKITTGFGIIQTVLNVGAKEELSVALGPHYLALASTGLFTGAKLTASATPGAFDVAEGTGLVIDATTDFETMEPIGVPLPATTAIVLTNIANAPVTYIMATHEGVYTQQEFIPTPEERRDRIFLGVIVHSDRSTVNAVNNTPSLSLNIAAQLQDLMAAIGLIRLRGNVVSGAVAGDLTQQKTGGSLFRGGVEFHPNPKDPHTVYQDDITTLTFRYRNQDSMEGSDTVDIDPSMYDLNGTTTSVGGGPNNTTIQRVSIFPSGIVRMQRGQEIFSSFEDGIAVVGQEPFVTETNIMENGLLLGAWVLKHGATDLTDDSEAQFFVASRFGEFTGGGGGASGGGGVAASDEAYGPTWEDDTTTPPSKNTLFDKFESLAAAVGSVTALTVEAKVNEAGGITKGQVVRIVGATGGFPQVSLASMDVFEEAHVLALAAETQSDGQTIVVMTSGLLEGIDTSDFAEGVKIYLGTAGAFTDEHPAGVVAIQRLGNVVRSNPSTGSILIELDALTIIDDFDGIVRFQLVNLNDGTSASTAFTLVNDAGHRSSISMVGSNFTEVAGLADTMVIYNEGYGKTVVAVDGNFGIEWWTDETDSHNLGATVKMALSASGNLTLNGTVDGRDIDADGTVLDGLVTPVADPLDHDSDVTGTRFISFTESSDSLVLISANGTIAHTGQIYGVGGNQTSIFNIVNELDFTTAEPAHSGNNIYLNTVTGSGSTTAGQTFTADKMYRSINSTWIVLTEKPGTRAFNNTTKVEKQFDGTDWNTITKRFSQPTAPSDQTALWFHTTDKLEYYYDTGRSKWLSTQEYSVTFGDDTQTGPDSGSAIYEHAGDVSTIVTSTRGRMILHDMTVVGAGWSNGLNASSNLRQRLGRYDTSGAVGDSSYWEDTPTGTNWYSAWYDLDEDFDAFDKMGWITTHETGSTAIDYCNVVVHYRRRPS